MSTLSRRLIGGWTELHVAAAAGDLARVRQVVQKSPSDMDKANKDRHTALHLAAAAGFEAVVGELLDRQAKTTVQDEAGRTPLHAAAVAGRSRCVAVLLGQRNRDPPAEKARLMGLRDREGLDALTAAVVEGQAAVVEEFLRAGVDAARCVDQSGCGLVLVAVQRGHVHLLPLLAPACGLEQRDPATGRTALHLAATKGDLPAIDWLQRAGASVSTRDNSGHTAGEAARAAGQQAACRLLREVPAQESRAQVAANAGSAASGTAHNLYGQTMNGGPGPSPGTGNGSGGGGAAVPTPPGYAAESGGHVGTHPLASWTPWQGGLPQQYAPAAHQVPACQEATAAAPPAAAATGRLTVPEEAPPAVYYPTRPDGASVYF